MRVVALLALISVVACSAPAAKKSTPPKNNANTNQNDDDNNRRSTLNEENDERENEEEEEEETRVGTPVNLTWKSPGADFVYSLDVKDANGDWVGPCLDWTIVGDKTSLTYEGVCTSASEKKVPNPSAYRIYFTRVDRADPTKMYWQDYVEASPERSTSSEVTFEAPKLATRVELSWNQREDSEYSLDVVLKNGTKIAPCVNSDSLGRSLSHTFNGNVDCSAPPQARIFQFKDVAHFVICSAKNGNWQNAVCGGIPYTGYGATRTISL